MIILFRPVGDAPILKQPKVKVRLLLFEYWSGTTSPVTRAECKCFVNQVEKSERFSKVVGFLRKQLGRDQVVSASNTCIGGLASVV